MDFHAINREEGRLDIVVFSRDRNSELLNSFGVWRNQPFRFIVLHNSKRELPQNLIPKNITYLYLPGVSYGERAGMAPTFIKSEFAAILADDEILLESGVCIMLAKLKSNLELASIGGKVLGIHKYAGVTTGSFAYRNMYGYENFEIDVAERLRNHLERPIKGEMPRASMYRIMRSEVMNSVLELFSKLTFVESPYIYEVAGEFAVAASGQTTTVEELYWIRNWQNRMVQHTNWDRSLSFTDWWIDSGNIHKKNSVVELLSEYAKIGLSETQRILNIYMARRVLVEEKGNKQVGNLWHALSVIKQKLFASSELINKPDEVLQILEKEVLGEQNMEKEVIAKICQQFLNETRKAAI